MTYTIQEVMDLLNASAEEIREVVGDRLLVTTVKVDAGGVHANADVRELDGTRCRKAFGALLPITATFQQAHEAVKAMYIENLTAHWWALVESVRINANGDIVMCFGGKEEIVPYDNIKRLSKNKLTTNGYNHYILKPAHYEVISAFRKGH